MFSDDKSIDRKYGTSRNKCISCYKISPSGGHNCLFTINFTI